MKTTKKKAINPEGLDLFLSFRMRLRSLEHARDEVRQAKADGEEILAQMATVEPTGDLLKDETVRAYWLTKLEQACDRYNEARRRVRWEMQDADLL